jgi:hypothetical protein
VTAVLEDDWEYPEVRVRDTALTADQKADCCWDRVRYTAEIPRVRHYGRGLAEVAPARFRLCAWHANTLRKSDPKARIFALPQPVKPEEIVQ